MAPARRRHPRLRPCTDTYACRRLQVKRMGLVGEHTVVAAAARRSESAKPYADVRAVLPPYMSPSLPT